MTRIVALLMLLGASAGAATIQLPLQGYYRVGRFMPIVPSEPSPISIEGNGLIPVRVQLGNTDAVFPLLITELADGQVAVNGEPQQLAMKSLNADERLVGVIDDTSGYATQLFAGKRIVSVPLNRANPFRGPAIAWEALDALVVEGALPASITRETISSLQAAGTTIAVYGEATPDHTWPWKRDGGWWILRANVVGPVSVITPSAYAPVANWSPGLSVVIRGQGVALGGFFAIAAIAVTLLRGRGLLPALLVVTALGLVATGAWIARQSQIRAVAGDVIYTGSGIQRDRWVYQTATRQGSFAIACGGFTKPMLQSAQQARDLNLVLECNPDGSPSKFVGTLPLGLTIAVISRTISATWDGMAILPGRDSPLQLLVRDAYLTPEIRVAGQTNKNASPQEWQGVVLERSSGSTVKP